MELLLSYKNKVAIYDFDGTSDAATFNSTTGGHLWSGLAGNPEKYSFFAVLGAPAREAMRNEIARVDTLVPATYATDAWQRVIAARDAAKALVDVRIYSIDGVNAVKSATAALTGAIGDYQAVTATGGVGGFGPGDAGAHPRRAREFRGRSRPASITTRRRRRPPTWSRRPAMPP